MQRAHTHRNLNRLIPLVSLLLLPNNISHALLHLASMTVARQAVRSEANFGFFVRKMLYQVTDKCFLAFNAVIFMLDGLIIFCDFCHVRCL